MEQTFSVTEICLSVITILLAILFGFLISLILQLKKTSRSAERIIDDFNNNLGPLIIKIDEASDHINHITKQMSDGINATNKAVNSIGNAASSIKKVCDVLSARNIKRKLMSTSAWAGVKTATEVLKNRLSNKGRNRL